MPPSSSAGWGALKPDSSGPGLDHIPPPGSERPAKGPRSVGLGRTVSEYTHIPMTDRNAEPRGSVCTAVGPPRQRSDNPWAQFSCGAAESALGAPLTFSSLFSGADAPGKMPQACPPAPVLAGQHGFDEIQIYEVIKALIIWPIHMSLASSLMNTDSLYF